MAKVGSGPSNGVSHQQAGPSLSWGVGGWGTIVEVAILSRLILLVALWERITILGTAHDWRAPCSPHQSIQPRAARWLETESGPRMSLHRGGTGSVRGHCQGPDPADFTHLIPSFMYSRIIKCLLCAGTGPGDETRVSSLAA